MSRAEIRTQEGKKPRLCIYQVMLGLAHRFLFAALIDADWLDSGNYYNQEGCLPPEQLPPWDLIESNVETFLNNLQPRHKIDTLRAEISEQCKTAGECAKLGIYRLYVPTGGGKHFPGCDIVCMRPKNFRPGIFSMLHRSGRLSDRMYRSSKRH